jgi:NTP pyrophosphatase (non-canonical NTP hydrolase)
MNLEKLQAYITEQNNNRRLWTENDTPEKIATYITQEAQELEGAIKEAFVTGDVFSVASEIGDVFYLVLKLCEELGIDPIQAAGMKLTRNSMKYGDHIMSNGRNFEEASGVSREVWKVFGSD